MCFGCTVAKIIAKLKKVTVPSLISLIPTKLVRPFCKTPKIPNKDRIKNPIGKKPTVLDSEFKIILIPATSHNPKNDQFAS